MCRGKRNYALIRLLFDLGLRRGEAVGLDLKHLDLAKGLVHVLGKGRRQREVLSLPAETVEALAVWIDARGTEPGPLFPSMDRARRGDGRLIGRSVGRMVRKLGRLAGPLRKA